MGFFDKFKEGLKKTRDQITAKTENILKVFKKIDEEFFEELEEMLIMADVGAETSDKIITELRAKVKKDRITEAENLRPVLAEIISNILSEDEHTEPNASPEVILVVGVNGVGKTTSIGKLAHFYKTQGKSVLIIAADTFRAAASDQLKIWAERAKVDIVSHREGADPSSVIFDGISAANARGIDVVLCDTAGRLHNKVNLMNELAKINRIIKSQMPEAHKEVYLVLDATTGQNAVSQASAFNEATEITGIILTKLDGTAKGGIVIAIKSSQNIPVRFIGVGEKIDDFLEFNPRDFANALFGRDSDNV